jgi:hypothetical protein
MTDPFAPPPSDAVARRALGWGLRCDVVDPGVDTGRDVRLRRGANGLLDLDLVSGMDCLVQDLAVALTTLLGGDVLNTAFGFAGLAAIAEERSPLLVRERLRVAVVGVLDRDPRVRRIIDVKFADSRLDPPSADPPAEEAATGGRMLAVTVAFETVVGQSMTVDLGGLSPVA